MPMSLAAAILLIAQSASPAAVDTATRASVPVAESVSATVRVLAPAKVSFAPGEDARIEMRPNMDLSVQQRRDAVGTRWVEFR